MVLPRIRPAATGHGRPPRRGTYSPTRRGVCLPLQYYILCTRCLHLDRSFGDPGALRHLTRERAQPQPRSRYAFGAYVRRCLLSEKERATRMESKPCSAERIVLGCESCRERIVLGGPKRSGSRGGPPSSAGEGSLRRPAWPGPARRGRARGRMSREGRADERAEGGWVAAGKNRRSRRRPARPLSFYNPRQADPVRAAGGFFVRARALVQGEARAHKGWWGRPPERRTSGAGHWAGAAPPRTEATPGGPTGGNLPC